MAIISQLLLLLYILFSCACAVLVLFVYVACLFVNLYFDVVFLCVVSRCYYVLLCLYICLCFEGWGWVGAFWDSFGDSRGIVLGPV